MTMATTKKTTDKAAEPAVDVIEPAAEPVQYTTVCVVQDGRCVGRAVNGAVCSYHAAQYRPNGTRRSQ